MKSLSRRADPARVGAADDQGGRPADARIAAILDEFATLLRQAVRRVCPRDLGIDLADVEQDARIRLWRALSSEREINDLASYIQRIAATATIDAIRRAKARREDAIGETADDEGGRADPFVSHAPSPERQAAGRSLGRAVKAALAGLARARRRAVGLHLQGLTTIEIGRVLGWSEPKARNLVYRGLTDLRHELRRMGIDDDAG